jgi:predicted RNase H-like HicB family nuclease
MLIDYIKVALEEAEYKKLEDGTWFGEIPGFEGVWANGKNIEICRRELLEVLEEWLLLKIKDNDTIPTIQGIDINIRKVAG